MSDKKPWDLSSTSALAGAAGYIRRASHARVVLIIRAEDVACSIDEGLQPMDAITAIRSELPGLLQFLIDRRAKKKDGK